MTKGEQVTASIDELGPVDYLVVEFPVSNFTGEIMPELVDLVQRGSSGRPPGSAVLSRLPTRPLRDLI